jgi:signal transduction histidine kinase
MNAVNVNVLDVPPAPPAADRTRQVLDVVHGLLRKPASGDGAAGPCLHDLAQAFAARAAGIAGFLEGVPCLHERSPVPGAGASAGSCLWEEFPDFVTGERGAAEIQQLRTAAGLSILVAAVEQPAGMRWLLWLEGDTDRAWGAADQAALALAALACVRLLTGGPEAAWEKRLEQKRLQRRLEEAAAVTGRLAHDFGNVLTGVQGFAELALAQLTPGSAPHRHVHEAYQTALKGARMIQELAQFGRRRKPGTGQAAPAPVLAEIRARLQPRWGLGVPLELDVPGKLPAVALDAEPLRQVLGHLLDNAREAITESGEVRVSVRPVALSEEDCLGYLGLPKSGDCVEIAVADTGGGIPPDVRRRLLNEVFFTTKPGHRGLGLAVVYVILQAHRGGFRIEPAPDGGTTVRVVLPVATPAPAAGPRQAACARGTACNTLRT